MGVASWVASVCQLFSTRKSPSTDYSLVDRDPGVLLSLDGQTLSAVVHDCYHYHFDVFSRIIIIPFVVDHLLHQIDQNMYIFHKMTLFAVLVSYSSAACVRAALVHYAYAPAVLLRTVGRAGRTKTYLGRDELDIAAVVSLCEHYPLVMHDVVLYGQQPLDYDVSTPVGEPLGNTVCELCTYDTIALLVARRQLTQSHLKAIVYNRSLTLEQKKSLAAGCVEMRAI